jgi:hypothetical protein
MVTSLWMEIPGIHFWIRIITNNQTVIDDETVEQ